jgi:hypothetical protein
MDVNLEEFIKFIDNNDEIDIGQTVTILSREAYIKAVDETIRELEIEEQKKLKKILERDDSQLYEIIEYYESIGKQKLLVEKAVDNVEVLRNEYIKHHLDSMGEDIKVKVFERFPTLRDL